MKFKKGDKCLCYGVICTIVDIDDSIAVLKSKAFDDGDGHDEVTFSLNELERISKFSKN